MLQYSWKLCCRGIGKGACYKHRGRRDAEGSKCLVFFSVPSASLRLCDQPFQGGNLLIVGEIIFKCFLLKAMPENVPLFKVKVVLQVPCQDEK